jgi:hypothetical protein
MEIICMNPDTVKHMCSILSVTCKLFGLPEIVKSNMSVEIRIQMSEDNKPVNLDIAQAMHLLVIKKNLAYFAHLHQRIYAEGLTSLYSWSII